MRRFWNYVSNNPLIAGALLLIVGSGSVWALVKPAGDWLSADAHVMRGAVLVLAMLLVGAVGALVVALRRGTQRAARTSANADEETAIAPTPLRSLIPTSPPQPPIGELANDLRRFGADIERLDTHLAEKARYLKSVVGTRVCWTGRVQSISTFSSCVTLNISVGDAPGAVPLLAFIDYPPSFREQVYEHRKGDRVEVTGIISRADELGPRVKGESLRVLV